MYKERAGKEPRFSNFLLPSSLLAIKRGWPLIGSCGAKGKRKTEDKMSAGGKGQAKKNKQLVGA